MPRMHLQHPPENGGRKGSQGDFSQHPLVRSYNQYQEGIISKVSMCDSHIIRATGEGYRTLVTGTKHDCVDKDSWCCESAPSLPSPPNCYTFCMRLAWHMDSFFQTRNTCILWFAQFWPALYLANMTQANASLIPRFFYAKSDWLYLPTWYLSYPACVKWKLKMDFAFLYISLLWHTWRACLDKDPPQ